MITLFFEKIFPWVLQLLIFSFVVGCTTLSDKQNESKNQFATSKILLTDLTKPADKRTYMLEDGQICKLVDD